MSVEEALPVVPAPWDLRGEAWWMLLLPYSAVPEAAYDPVEAPTADLQHFRGGFATVQIVRYKESPVGPYDEIIFCPGDFETPGKTHKQRITRIYVSTRASVLNGRRNWNIPKHLARFEFTPHPKGGTRIAVHPHEPADSPPFFVVRASPQRFIPSLPLDVGLLPVHLPLVQPPLPAGLDAAAEVATVDWASVHPHMWGRVQLAWFAKEDGWDSYGDGVGFPLSPARSFGSYWPDIKMIFPPSGEVDTKPR